MKLLKRLSPLQLSKQQFVAISEIARDSAQVIFGGLVINQVFSSPEKINWSSLVIGVISCVGLWVMSVLILKK